MRTYIFIFTFLVLGMQMKAQDMGSVLKKLDRTVEDRATYATMKETSIDHLKKMLRKASTDTDKYHYLDRIEEEYRPFSIDSSFCYIAKKRELAIKMNNKFYLCASDLNYADIYTKSGYFLEAMQILEKYNKDNIPYKLYGYYLGILKVFYELQMESAIVDKDREIYREKLNANRKKRIEYFKDTGYKIPIIDEFVEAGAYDKAEEILNECLRETGETHSRSIYYYLLAKINGYRNETDKRAYNLAQAAINDIRLGVREYKALSELAIILYSKGDIERADKYLKASMDDAALCNARPRYLVSVNFFTLVDSAYQKKIDTQNRYIVITLVIISLFALALSILLRMFYRKNTKLRIARKNLHEANKTLSEVNRQLKESYKRLEDATIIKDEYIGMYMDQCSSYLTKLDSYRKSLRKMLTTGNMDELSKAIKSGEFVEQEVKEFYANFDMAFLHLYPNFTEEFNRLLKEGEEILTDSAEKLTAELRIYALVRLGIDDSVKIAQFLRYSVSTIYNYRTKMRNKAKGDRNSFDEQVKKIGIV